MKSKYYVFDTNVILDNAHVTSKFQGTVVIPTTVLQELDKHKQGNTEKNRNAREFARLANKEGCVFTYYHSHEYETGSNDDKITRVALELMQEDSESEVYLVTNDIYMTVLAKSHNIEVIKGDDNFESEDTTYKGLEVIDELPADFKEFQPEFPNKYYITKSGMFRHTHAGLARLGKDKSIWGIKHKNAEQKCALDALMNDDIKLVTLSGKAGSGKTLLAIAAGLEKTVSENKYRKIMVSRPIIPMGNDIGFLPGTMEEKLGPWMQPIFDNIDFLFNQKGERANDAWMELEKEGILKLEALTYIRGRSIPDHFVIIDEAQNLSKHEIKTIISRVGENTKIILTGDPDQIDNPKLDSINNGLSYVIEKFKDQKIAAHVTLTKCERSELADLAAELL